MTSLKIPPPPPIALGVGFDPLHPFSVPELSPPEFVIPSEKNSPIDFDLPPVAPQRDLRSFQGRDRFQPAAVQKKSGGYRAPDWQFYAATHFVDADHMAGFANDGVHYDGVSTTDSGEYRLSASGFTTGAFGPPLELGAQYVRKRPIWDVDEMGQPKFDGEYMAVGPSLRFSASIQELQRDDYYWEATFDDSEIRAMLDDSATAVTGSFDTDIPSFDLEELEAWANENLENIEEIPGLWEGIWSTYDPSSDFHTDFKSGAAYGVPVVRLNADVGGEFTHWNSRTWIQGPHSFRVSAVGSLLYLGGPNTAIPVFLGVGPQMELTALTVNVRPEMALSVYGYLGAQYFHGFTWEDGFAGNNSMFIESHIGAGVRGTFPAIRDPASIKPRDTVSGSRENFDETLQRIYGHIPDLGNVSE